MFKLDEGKNYYCKASTLQRLSWFEVIGKTSVFISCDLSSGFNWKGNALIKNMKYELYSHKFGLHAFTLTLTSKSFTHYQKTTAARNQ